MTGPEPADWAYWLHCASAEPVRLPTARTEDTDWRHTDTPFGFH